MGFLDYLIHSRKIVMKKGVLPEQITLFSTNKCNLKCKHCFIWKHLNVKSKKDLTAEEIEKFSQSVNELTYLLIGGGEPFIRNDIDEIVESFNRNSNVLNVAIVTNGVLSEKIIKTTKKILRNYRKHLTVNISFDGIGRDHDEMRGCKGVFEKAKKTCLELKKLTKKHKNFDVGVIMTCTPFNQENLNAAYKYIKNKIKPDSIVLNYMRGNPREKTSKKIDLNRYVGLSKKIEEDNIKGYVKGHHGFALSDLNLAAKMLMRETIHKTVKKNTYVMPCYAGMLNVIVHNNGDVYPCELLDMKIGNLKKSNYNFKKIWFSKKADDIRKFIKKSKCFCTEECNTNMNILFNPKYIPALILKFAKIKYSKIFKRKQ